MTSYIPSSSERTSTRSRVTFAESTKYSFKTTWYDKVADCDREYIVTIYLETKEIEIVDVRRKMMFLKRSPYPELDMSQFYIGNAIVIHGRQHNIIDYANEFTKNVLQTANERSLAIVKPHCYAEHPEAIAVALQRIQQAGLTVARLQLT